MEESEKELTEKEREEQAELQSLVSQRGQYPAQI